MSSVQNIEERARADAAARYAANKPLNGTHPAIVDNSAPVILPDVEEKPDGRPAPERIESLFRGMPGGREVLLSVIDTCREGASDAQVEEAVVRAQRNNRSVYSAFTLCRLLERAGAIEHLNEDGEPFDEASEEPTEIEEDGAEYLQAAVPPASLWKATQAGIDYADADDPAARTQALLEEEREYLPVYKYLLKACEQGGRTKDLSAKVDGLPLVQKPRKYVQHFLEGLERAGALEWTGSWRTTSTGERALAGLSAVQNI